MSGLDCLINRDLNLRKIIPWHDLWFNEISGLHVETVDIYVSAIVEENWCLPVRSVQIVALISFCCLSPKHTFVLGGIEAIWVENLEIVKAGILKSRTLKSCNLVILQSCSLQVLQSCRNISFLQSYNLAVLQFSFILAQTLTLSFELDKICLELGIMDWVNHSFLRNFRFMF